MYTGICIVYYNNIVFSRAVSIRYTSAVADTIVDMCVRVPNDVPTTGRQDDDGAKFKVNTACGTNRKTEREREREKVIVYIKFIVRGSMFVAL